MKEIFTSVFVAVIALFMAGYSVHMIIGGMVSKMLEREIIAGILLVLAGVLAYMARDLRKRKRGD